MFTYSQLQSWAQERLKDSSAATLVFIKQIINGAYKRLLAIAPTYWSFKSGTLALVPDDKKKSLAADCRKLVAVHPPAGEPTYKMPLVVGKHDWENWRRPIEATGQPVLFYPAGYSTSCTTGNVMDVHIFPACHATGTWPYDYYGLPPDLDGDDDITVFGDTWEDLLINEVDLGLLRYEGRYEEAGVLEGSLTPIRTQFAQEHGMAKDGE